MSQGAKDDPLATDLGIIDLLKVFGFDERLKAKLVRHQDSRYDIPSLMREGWFDLYQSLQARPVFGGCKRFSILQVLPKTTAAAEVIRWESLYKAKLGSRATGLNVN